MKNLLIFSIFLLCFDISSAQKTNDIEKIFIENSGFSMERKFVLCEGKWFLKEYKISNL